MRSIVSKELALVLERRGLRNREWAVEWEASALELLLDKVFSTAMGARPLKRAIDQHLLAPFAATLVEHRFPEGDSGALGATSGRSPGRCGGQARAGARDCWRCIASGPDIAACVSEVTPQAGLKTRLYETLTSFPRSCMHQSRDSWGLGGQIPLNP
jgi:hypothetical protein